MAGADASTTSSAGTWGATASTGAAASFAATVSFRAGAVSTGVLCGRGASETSADGTCGTPATGASALGVGMAFGPACGKAEETSVGAVAGSATVTSPAVPTPDVSAATACPVSGSGWAMPCACSASGTCVAPAGSPPLADSPAGSAAASSVAAKSAAAAWAAAASSFSFFLRRKKPNMSCVLCESAAVCVAAILEPVRPASLPDIVTQGQSGPRGQSR